jgi:hypothetical protein
MFRLKWIPLLDKVYMYLIDPHTGYPLSVKEYLHFEDAINDLSNTLSNIVLPENWISKDGKHEYKIVVHDNGSSIKDYIEVFYNFLGIPISSAEQLAIILKNNKKVDFKKVQDSELINEYCEDLIADNMNFEVHITNI